MLRTPHIEEPRWTGTREVLVMAWPIILSSISHTVMEFCDKWMVSQLGTAPLAAVGSASIWSFTLSTVLLGTVGCVSTFAAQSLGRGNLRNCANYAWQGVYLSLAAGALLLVLWPVSGPLFRLMGHGAEVTRYELLYFRLRLLGYPAMACAVGLASFFQAVNHPRVPMWAAILSMAANLLFNYVLIFGKFGFPALGVAGAAIGTVFAMYLHGGLLLAVFLSARFHAAFGTRTAWRFEPRRTRELVRIGAYSGGSMFLDVANWSIFTSFIVGSFGTVPLAAHTIALSFMHVSFMPAVAMNQAVAALVGQWIGRGDIARAKSRTYVALRISAAYMLAMGLFFAVFGSAIIGGLFSDDAAVIALGHRLLILAAVFQGFDAVNIICMGGLRGAGDTRWMMWVMFLTAYIVFLPLALLFAFVLGGGAFGAWVAATIFITGLSVMLFRRFHGEAWRGINIFSEESRPEIAAVPGPGKAETEPQEG